MLYLKKYYPFFVLQETAMGQYKDGQYRDLDMGYITMALLRFLIQENHFNGRTVAFPEVERFLGAVLRRENVEALKQNGTVVFLDRPLEDLLPTDDRPLADDVNKLKALYETRYPIYTAAADMTVPVFGTPEAAAEAILEKLQ